MNLSSNNNGLPLLNEVNWLFFLLLILCEKGHLLEIKKEHLSEIKRSTYYKGKD